MNANTSIAIFFGTLFISVSGCCIMQSRYEASVEIERQKTRQIQMQLQAKIDSTQLANQLLKLKIK